MIGTLLDTAIIALLAFLVIFPGSLAVLRTLRERAQRSHDSNRRDSRKPL